MTMTANKMVLDAMRDAAKQLRALQCPAHARALEEAAKNLDLPPAPRQDARRVACQTYLIDPTQPGFLRLLATVLDEAIPGRTPGMAAATVSAALAYVGQQVQAGDTIEAVVGQTSARLLSFDDLMALHHVTGHAAFTLAPTRAASGETDGARNPQE